MPVIRLGDQDVHLTDQQAGSRLFELRERSRALSREGGQAGLWTHRDHEELLALEAHHARWQDLRQRAAQEDGTEGQAERVDNSRAGYGQAPAPVAGSERGHPGGGRDPAAAFDRARRLIDTRHRDGGFPDLVAERALELLTGAAPQERSTATEYVEAAGAAEYETAFAKSLSDP